MDQSYYFPNPTPEPSSSSNNAAGSTTEGYRPTSVHRLPQTGPLASPSKGVITGRLFLHLLLLAFTALTTTAVGVFWFYDQDVPEPQLHALGVGIVYSFTILTILAAHEMGHYIACCWYGVNATLPYFIPVPIPPVGTFGAFIKIKSPIPNRRALFDIGIAGPLAGFVFAIPAAFIAHYFAEPAKPLEVTEGIIYFNDPLLFQLFKHLLHLPDDIANNPVWWAAWVGVFMTSLNLLPVGQLDGGHVTYAVFGSRGHRIIAIGCYLGVITLAIYSMRSGMWNWVVYAVILTLMLRVGHPPLVDDDEPLGLARKVVAVIGLLVFILSFMPFPISF
jgi:membrane-associated protease RseP (regulator of RpoE activity)